jgi:hypothetical protein
MPAGKEPSGIFQLVSMNKKKKINQSIQSIVFSFPSSLVGFSYNRTQAFSVPGTKKGMKALVTGKSTLRRVLRFERSNICSSSRANQDT